MNENSDNALNFLPIGYVSSPYKEKFAIPRQPGLVTAAQGKIVLHGQANNNQLVRGLAEYSHIWVIFVFHGTQSQGWQPLVRPPRLGGNKKIGVLATRSTFRPNPIGMSVVSLDEVTTDGQHVQLHISGLDLLDKTPVLDIKPYIAYSDSIANATSGIAVQAPDSPLAVEFNNASMAVIADYQSALPHLKVFIEQVLSQDPRPAYKQGKTDDKAYGMRLHDFNIQWQMTSLNSLTVTAIIKEHSE